MLPRILCKWNVDTKSFLRTLRLHIEEYPKDHSVSLIAPLILQVPTWPGSGLRPKRKPQIFIRNFLMRKLTESREEHKRNSQVLALCASIVRSSHLPWKQLRSMTCSYKPGSLTLPPSAKPWRHKETLLFDWFSGRSPSSRPPVTRAGSIIRHQEEQITGKPGSGRQL